MHLIITGGHLTPAVSLLEYLHGSNHRITFIGREQSSLEANFVTELGYQFIAFDAPKFNRYQTIRSLWRFPRLLPAFIKIHQLLLNLKPDVYLSFGGYLSIPIALACVLQHIPIVVHEQTAVAGLANEFVARFARAIALSYPMSRSYFPGKTTVVGNLLRAAIFNPPKTPPLGLPAVFPKPLLFITGGNQGSQVINHLVSSLYDRLAQDYFLVHQTGHQPAFSQPLPANLILKPHFTTLEMAWLFSQAHLVIARAGANTVTELIAFQIPSLLIPLPHTHHHEQEVHARLFTQAHGGLTLPQANLSAPALLQALAHLETTYPEAVLGLKSLRHYLNPQACRDLFNLIKRVIHET